MFGIAEKQMGRAKIPIKWIPRDTSRNMTFMKRKKGLKKKVEELSILCGVEACMVCFGQMDQQNASDHPDVWPGKSKALEIVERYRSLSKEEQEKKKLDNSSFLEQRIKKLKVELSIKRKENTELEMEALYPWDTYLNFFTDEQLRDLVDYIDIKLENVHDRISFLTRQEYEISNGVIAESDMVPLRELECIDRKLMEGGGSYNFMMPYHNGDENLSSGAGHVKPYPGLEGHYKALVPSCGTTTMDNYSKVNPLFIASLKDYHSPNSKEVMDNGEDDRIVVSNAHLMVNKSFPLLGTDDVNHIQSNTGSCPQWCCSITPCSLHNPLHSSCPQHYGMNPAIQQVQFSYKPHHQQWFNEMMESQTIQKMLGEEGTNSAHNNSIGPPPILLSRSLGTNDQSHIKNIQDFEALKKQKS